MPFDPNPWGYKVLAVSYGGSLQMYGSKGVRKPDASKPATCPMPNDPANVGFLALSRSFP